MTFLELQNELLTVPAARFNSTQRDSVKKWINHRYAILWGLDDWTFKQTEATVTVTAGTATVTTPSTLGVIKGFWRDDGQELTYLRTRAFNSLYYAQTGRGSPEHYKFVNGTLTLGPIPSTSSSSYSLWHERLPHVGSNPVTGPPLVADGDVPLIPVTHHYMLVPGSTSVGSVQMNDFTYQFAEQEWQNDLVALRLAYLENAEGPPQQLPAYRPL